jgi:2-hydroxy-3-oxopropionate reductase
MAERIGFIGLGIMGRPMAINLIKAGYQVIAHDIVRSAAEDLLNAGAADGGSAKGVTQQSDIVITMLPDSPQVRDVVLGKHGVIDGARAGQILADMSTISPLTSREVAEALTPKGVQVLDAPVSGGQKGAIEAALSIMVGGPKAAFERVLPVFQAMGKNIVHIGDEPGSGQVTKACNQIVVGVTIMAVSEALTLARKSGVDPAKVRSALLGGFAQSRILDLHGQRILDRNFQPGFRVKLHLKDLGIALAAGHAYGVPLFATGLVHEVMEAMVAQGQQDLDHSAVAKFVESLAGVEGGP